MCCQFGGRGTRLPTEPVVCETCRTNVETWLQAYEYPRRNRGTNPAFCSVLNVEVRIHGLLVAGLTNAQDGDLLDAYVDVITWANLSHPVIHSATAQAAIVASRQQILGALRTALLPQPISVSAALSILDGLPGVDFATATKFLMFHDPTCFPVLDSKIAHWIENLPPRARTFTWTPELLKRGRASSAAYQRWCSFTADVAGALNMMGSRPAYPQGAGAPSPATWRPADVERAVFQSMNV